jgi:penicillin amidase
LHPGYPYTGHPTITDQGGGQPRAATADAAPQAEDSGAGAGEGGSESALDSSAYADRLQQVAASVDRLPQLLGPAGDDIGSNSWVVAGTHTASGKPLLANDPHLGAALPSVWYQMGLHCTTVGPECPFDVAGFSFSGFPGIIIGHNDRISWGFTNLGPDVADLFVEKVTGDSYEYDGAQVPVQKRKERIRVAGGKDVTITVRSTVHGPIVTDIGDAYAVIAKDQAGKLGVPAQQFQLSLAWTALTPGRTANAIFAFDTARDWASFRAAAQQFQVPSQNLVYADVDGHIGYQAPGLIPTRAAGDGTVPVPGWTSQYAWTGTIPFDRLPSVFDPPAGYIVTANNAAVGPSFPELITADWDQGYRANQIEVRLADLVAKGTKVTAKDMAAIQADTYDANAAALVPVLREVAAKPGAEGDLLQAARLLDGWDYRDDADSAAAAYFAVFWKELLHDMFARKLPAATAPTGGDRWFSVVHSLLGQPDSSWWADEDLGTTDRDSMISYAAVRAWAEARRLLGGESSSWRWDDLHTLTLKNASLGESGVAPIEWLFNRGPWHVGGGSSIVDATGWDASEGFAVNRVPSMRMVVDLSDFDRSTWINLTGASGHAFDAHYTDQTDLWASGRTRPWPFSAAAVKQAATQTLTLRPSR